MVSEILSQLSQSVNPRSIWDQQRHPRSGMNGNRVPWGAVHRSQKRQPFSLLPCRPASSLKHLATSYSTTQASVAWTLEEFSELPIYRSITFLIWLRIEEESCDPTAVASRVLIIGNATQGRAPFCKNWGGGGGGGGGGVQPPPQGRQPIVRIGLVKGKSYRLHKVSVSRHSELVFCLDRCNRNTINTVRALEALVRKSVSRPLFLFGHFFVPFTFPLPFSL